LLASANRILLLGKRSLMAKLHTNSNPNNHLDLEQRQVKESQWKFDICFSLRVMVISFGQVPIVFDTTSIGTMMPVLLSLYLLIENSSYLYAAVVKCWAHKT